MASEAWMAGRQTGFWDVEDRLRQLSERGDTLEKLDTRKTLLFDWPS